MPECPNCKFEFFEYKPTTKPRLEIGEILAHECSTGYLRPYRSEHCSDCFRALSEFNTPIPKTLIAKRESVMKENRKRKTRYFREMDMTTVELEEEATEAQEA
jgi:hypothetical protein